MKFFFIIIFIAKYTWWTLGAGTLREKDTRMLLALSSKETALPLKLLGFNAWLLVVVASLAALVFLFVFHMVALGSNILPDCLPW